MTPALVIVTTSFPIAADGSEAAGGFVADLAIELSRQVPVRIVAPGLQDARETWAPGVEVFRFAVPGKALSTLRPWHPFECWGILKVLMAGDRATRIALDAGPVAHVFALWALPSGHWARMGCTARGLRYSVWTLGSDIWSLGRLPGVRSVLRRVLAGAQCCYSDGLQLARDTAALGAHAVSFLPSTRSLDSSRVSKRRARPPYRLLFLGRWHRNKGIDLLIDALNLLAHADWARIESVSICGGGPLHAEVNVGVDALQRIGRPVRLTGFLDKPAAQTELGSTDIVLIPSRIESIPVVFSDAVKFGCALASMPVGDLTTLVTETPACGAVADGLSAAAFARMLSGLLAQSLTQFDTGIEERARRFSLQAVVARLQADLLAGMNE